MGNCIVKVSFVPFYLSFIFALLCLGICTAFLYIVGGPPPVHEYDIGSKVFFFGNITQIIFLLIALLLCKHKVTDKCAFGFCEFGLLASLAASCFVIYSFQDFKVDSQKIQEYSTLYMKMNGNTNPYIDFLQKNFPCCGVSSFSDYAVKINEKEVSNKISIPSSCCKKEEKPNNLCSRTNLDYFSLMIEYGLEEKILETILNESSTLNLKDGKTKKAPGIEKWMSQISSDSSFVNGYRRQFMKDEDDFGRSNSNSSSTNKFRLQTWKKMESLLLSSIKRRSADGLRTIMTTEISNKLTKCQVDEYIDQAVQKLAEEEFNKTYDVIKNIGKGHKTSSISGSSSLETEFSIDVNLLGCGKILEDYVSSTSSHRGHGILLFFVFHSDTLKEFVNYLGGHFEEWEWKEETYNINTSKIIDYFLLYIIGLNLLVFLQFNVLYIYNCCRRKRTSREFEFLDNPE